MDSTFLMKFHKVMKKLSKISGYTFTKGIIILATPFLKGVFGYTFSIS